MPHDNAAREFRVRISSNGVDGHGGEAQTPGRSLRWGNCRFEINPRHDGACDFWIVVANARPIETATVAPENTLFISGEPPSKKIYPRRFYKQFSHIVDTHDGSRHPGLRIEALGLPWLVGFSWAKRRYTLGYDEFKAMPYPEKQNRISAVTSSTRVQSGQRARLRFLDALKERLGDDLVVFGKGIRTVDDKLEGILPYRFHLSLENSQSPYYWTEKLTDAYLGWAYPFYVGCPNIGDYFSPDSYTPLDMKDVDGAVAKIRAALARPTDEQMITALRAARERVLDVYGPYAWYARWVNEFYRPELSTRKVVIRSAKAFRPFDGWYYRWRFEKPGTAS